MKQVDIVQNETKEGKVLREVSKKVLKKDITSKHISDILKEMEIALASQEDGVALAAPQIGVGLRIFIVSPKIFKESEIKPQLVFINPEIIKRSRDKKLLEEGCLSVRWWYGKIRRASRVTISSYNELGEKFEITTTGLLAQIFQHETDHLDGILFIDNAKELKELPQKNDK